MADSDKNQQFNQFSEKSKARIRSMRNTCLVPASPRPHLAKHRQLHPTSELIRLGTVQPSRRLPKADTFLASHACYWFRNCPWAMMPSGRMMTMSWSWCDGDDEGNGGGGGVGKAVEKVMSA